LSLVENDRARNTYWLTPLLREELWNQLQTTSDQQQATSNKQPATSNQQPDLVSRSGICILRKNV